MLTKEQRRKYNQSYYEKNKDKLKGEAIAYYHDNKEKVLENVARYRESNRPLLRENDKKYYRDNLEIRLLGAARARAKKTGLEFNIDITDIKIPEFCPLLGIKLEIANGQKTCKGTSASLDRIDSTKGYVKGNVWVISHKANTMKSNSSFEEFMLMAKRWEKYKELNYSTLY